jgi:hypothetical protein
MIRAALMGMAAGAVGTVALNVTTYADMVVRARPSSSVPSQVAGKLAQKAGIDLGSEEAAENRKSGLGALQGYVAGLGVGAAYGLIRPHLDDASVPLAGVGLGLAAMAASDIPATALGVTDPRKWSLNSWASDAVPHLAYGLVTAATCEVFGGK